MDRDQERRAIRAVLDGDPEPYSEIVKGYQNLVASVAWKMNVKQQDIDDIVSEVFLKVYKNLDRYDESYAFSTWLYRLTTNHILDQIRKRNRRKETDLEAIPEVLDPSEGADQGIVRDERQQIVRDALSSLSAIYQEVLVLHYLQGMPVSEVSASLGLPEGTVKVRLMRGRKKLKGVLTGTASEYFGGVA